MLLNVNENIKVFKYDNRYNPDYEDAVYRFDTMWRGCMMNKLWLDENSEIITPQPVQPTSNSLCFLRTGEWIVNIDTYLKPKLFLNHLWMYEYFQLRFNWKKSQIVDFLTTQLQRVMKSKTIVSFFFFPYEAYNWNKTLKLQLKT